MTRDMAWLIEKRDPNTGQSLYWDAVGWTTDSLLGVRFARKSDAAVVIDRQRLEGCVPNEHEWVPPSTPAAPSWRAG